MDHAAADGVAAARAAASSTMTTTPAAGPAAVTVIVTGTSLGIRGVIFPLVVGTALFFARLVETALREVDRGIIEASLAMGASTTQTIFRAVLPEALRPSVLSLHSPSDQERALQSAEKAVCRAREAAGFWHLAD